MGPSNQTAESPRARAQSRKPKAESREPRAESQKRMLIDSHCHLADEVFADDLASVVERAREAGVDGALCILSAGDQKESAAAGRVRALWPAVNFSVGIHPHHAGQFAGRIDEAVTC